jgi:hypothetical protein
MIETGLIFLLAFGAVLPAFSKIYGNREKYILFVFFVIMFMMAGFRDSEKFIDYDTYVLYYTVKAKYVEPSFQFISLFVHKYFNNVIALFVIYAILGVGIKIIAIRQLSGFAFFSLLIYMSYFFLLHECTQIRSGVAAGFILLCVKQIYDRNFIKFAIFAGLAVFFHAAALIVIPLWVLKREKINRYLYAALIPAAVLLYVLNMNILNIVEMLTSDNYLTQKAVLYSQKTEEINVFNYVFLVKCFFYYLLLWKVRFIAKHNKYAVLLIKMHGIAFFSFVILAGIPTVAFRVSQLFEIVEIITIPMLLHVFKPAIAAKFAMFFFVIGMLCINIFHGKLIIM